MSTEVVPADGPAGTPAATPLLAALATLARARPAAPPSAAERVAGALSEQILEGGLRPGTRLTEESVAEALAVSRNTVREAFALLVSERIVVREPNRGVFVASPGPQDVADLYATRLLIEPAAVLWGPGLTEARLAELRAAVDRGKQAQAQERWDGVASANQQFHRALAAIGGSRRIDQHMGSVLAETRLVFHRMGETREFHAPYLQVNDDICALLEAGQREDAATLLRSYLEGARDQLLHALTASQG